MSSRAEHTGAQAAFRRMMVEVVSADETRGMEAHPSTDEHLAELMAEGKVWLESQSERRCFIVCSHRKSTTVQPSSSELRVPPGFPTAIQEVLEMTMGPRANSMWAGPGGGPRWPWNRACNKGCSALDWEKEEALVCISQ